jgi:hypothetical protein
MTDARFALFALAIYLPLILLMLWLAFGKQIRRWWRKRKLNIPNEEENVRTISGPLWEVSWIKVSEAAEKHPERQDSTVLAHELAEAMLVLKAKYGDEFDEKNVHRANKQSYSNVIVGIPDESSQHRLKESA